MPDSNCGHDDPRLAATLANAVSLGDVADFLEGNADDEPVAVDPYVLSLGDAADEVGGSDHTPPEAVDDEPALVVSLGDVADVLGGSDPTPLEAVDDEPALVDSPAADVAAPVAVLLSSQQEPLEEPRGPADDESSDAAAAVALETLAGLAEEAQDATAEEALQRRARRWRVKLDRSQGGRLGIDVETGRESKGWDGKTVLVKGIQAVGLIPAWNVEFPDDAVRVGDRIVEINGICGDTLKLIQECQNTAILNLILERETAATQDAMLSDSVDEAAIIAAAAWPCCANEDTVRALQQEIIDAKSATSIVQMVRRELTRHWSLHWAAPALHTIWRRSTLRTRKEWLQEGSVVQLADGLRREMAAAAAGGGACSETSNGADFEALLVALEALRRLGLQEPESQRLALVRLATRLKRNRWSECTTADLVRLFWLAAPMKLEAVLPVLRQLRLGRCKSLRGVDIVLLISGMHTWSTTKLIGQARHLRRNSALSIPDSCRIAASSEFRLSFDLTLHGTSEEPASIFRLQVDDLELAGRMLTICNVPGTTRLLCALGDRKAWTSKYYSLEPGIGTGEPTRITARVGPSAFTIHINGEEASGQPRPKPFQSRGASKSERAPRAKESSATLTFWAADDMYNAANASIGNLTYRTLHCEGRDEALLQQIGVKLQADSIYRGLLISELVLLAEGLNVLEVRDGAALRALGQEILSRRGELSPQEAKRVHIAFLECKQPLTQVWEAVGAKRRCLGQSIQTRQAFAVQPGHEERLQNAGHGEGREAHEIERVSPPRFYGDQYRTTF